MSATRAEILLAYRKLYQHALRAVKYTSPDSIIVREKLRHAFRESPKESFDAARIARTTEFLDNAARMKGLETKIVKNLIHIAWGKHKVTYTLNPAMHASDRLLRRQAYDQVDATVEKLNESMGLCLR